MEYKMTNATALSESPYGYQRSAELQEQFLQAAEHLRSSDGWANPDNGDRQELRADLVLEGGGVKSIAFAGAVLALSEAGYTFGRVAGTSAGAIAASVIAGIVQAGREMTSALGYLRSLDFQGFMPQGRLHGFLDRAVGHMGDIVADAAILTSREGVYSSAYLESWLGPILHDDLGIKTFADLRLTPQHDSGLSVPDGQAYRLVVYTSDITRGRLVRLPWDYPQYGHLSDDEDPVQAVRASISIPFFFEPVHFIAHDATVEVPVPGGGTTTVNYRAGTETWVDGALLANYPIHAFDREDGKAPRWPTIGIKLSRFQTEYPSSNPCESAMEIAVRCLQTMMNEWDPYAAHETVASRTIFVDNAGLNATDFDLTKEQQDRLFLNGVEAATQFVIAMASMGGVPRI
jgi:NTE family protein